MYVHPNEGLADTNARDRQVIHTGEESQAQYLAVLSPGIHCEEGGTDGHSKGQTQTGRNRQKYCATQSVSVRRAGGLLRWLRLGIGCDNFWPDGLIDLLVMLFNMDSSGVVAELFGADQLRVTKGNSQQNLLGILKTA